MGQAGGVSRRLDIQGLRAVAVGLVVAYHAGLPVPGGFIGVDMFFVISGFVIAAMLIRHLDEPGGLSFRAFYTRRMRRLLPAMALLSIVVATASTFLLSPLGPQQATARTGVAASVFAANIQLAGLAGSGYFDLRNETNALLHTWSLSVEEQFYLVFPAFLVLAWRLGTRWSDRWRRRSVAAVVVSAAVGASFALSVITTYHPSYRLGTKFAFYASPSRAWEFGAGVLLALAVPLLTRLHHRLAAVTGVLGLGLVVFGAFALDGTTDFPGFAALLPVAGTALLIIAGTVSDRGITAALSVRPAVWVGDVSYGWYLWHWPLIVFAAAMWPGREEALVLVSLASLVPTALSYRYVENPIRFNDAISGRRVVPLLVVCIIAPVLAFLGLSRVSHVLNDTDTVREYADGVARLHADRARNCDQPLALEDRTNPDCTWPAPDDGPKAGEIYLVGDSNSGHFTEPSVAAANGAGYALTVASSAGCPFVDLIRSSSISEFDGEACHDAVMASIETLAERRPQLVIIAASSTEYVTDPTERLRDPETGKVALTTEDKARLWAKGVESVLARLAEADVPTLVLHTVPQFGPALGATWNASTCPALRIFGGTCGGTISRTTAADAQRPAKQAEQKAVASVPLSASLDFFDVLCDDASCATRRNDTWMYRDGTHLSIDGALTLTDRLAAAIEQRAA